MPPARDGVPDPASKRPKLAHRKPAGDEVIVLSVFDGVGAAPWLVWDLVGRPAAMFAWETDRAATAVAKAQIPGLSCRGDLNDDDPAKVADVIEKVDPWGRCLIIFSGRRHPAKISRVSPTVQATTATAAGCSCRRWSS